MQARLQATCQPNKPPSRWLKGYPEYADSEMQQALVVILLELRKTPRRCLGRFSVKVFLRIQDTPLILGVWLQHARSKGME